MSKAMILLVGLLTMSWLRQNGKIMPTVGVCADEVSEHIPKLRSSFWCIMGTCSVLLSCLNFRGEWA